jgi:predicted ribosomally synthesized peptide with SipW-like signal peptide
MYRDRIRSAHLAREVGHGESTMADDNNIYNLSRRKALMGLGTIGVAGAAAGMGTSALFSDEESFTNNSITAGTLNMVVDAEIVATVDNDYWDTLSLEGTSQTADGSAVDMAIDIDDAKPGDWLIICFEITNEENPGYVQISTSNLVDDENTVTEPEADSDEENNSETDTPIDGEGELAEAMLATTWNEFDDTTTGDDRSDLSGLQYPTNQDGDDKPSHSWDSGRAEDGNVSGESNIDYTNLRQAHDNFSSGVVVRDSSSNNQPVGTNATDVDGPAADYDPAVFYLLLEIPKSVGNEIQSDSVGLDLTFESEQVRNNNNPFN